MRFSSKVRLKILIKERTNTFSLLMDRSFRKRLTTNASKSLNKTTTMGICKRAKEANLIARPLTTTYQSDPPSLKKSLTWISNKMR